MDEARTVMRRLERIEVLQSADAPARELLAEVRKLLREGEAWLAAEHARSGRPLPGPDRSEAGERHGCVADATETNGVDLQASSARTAARSTVDERAGESDVPTERAAAALAGCRRVLSAREEEPLGSAETTFL